MLSCSRQGDFKRTAKLGAAVLLLACAATLNVGPVKAEDSVYLTGKQVGNPATKIVGTVLDYTGKAVRIEVGGVERSYPGARVLKIESTYRPEHQAAITAIEEGQFVRAITLLRAANNQEPRLWMRRRMLYELIECYRATDESQLACETFLLLVGSDPTTPYFDCIPLAWTAGDAVPKAKSETWLARQDVPASMLLGASHLLATDTHVAATAALKLLANSDDSQVAPLAQAQLWRLVFHAQREETDLWQRKLEVMPERLRAGPYFLLGSALLGQKRYEEAALTLMRVPILYKRDHDLSAASLVAAGDALVALGRAKQAISLWREVISDHALTKWKADVELRLERIEK